MRRGWLLAAFLVVGGAPGAGPLDSSAEAATAQALSPGRLADRSTLVFIGTVQRQASRFVAEQGHVVTDTVFAIEQVVKGPDKHQARFELTQLGGSVGEGAARRGTEVPGYARFAEGERVLLFLEPTSRGRLVPTGLAQGKYLLKTDDKTGEVMALRDLHGLHTVGAGPQRHLLGAPQNPNRMPLGQLLSVVRGERPVQPIPLRGAIHDVPSADVPSSDVPSTGAGEVSR